MKEIKKLKKSPFFYFHSNCGKVCPTDSDFFDFHKIRIGWTNFAAVAMETKKGEFEKKFDSFHQTS
jgi:hypothetical protein